MNRTIAQRSPLVAPALLLGAIVLATVVPGILLASPATASPEACADGSGVTVIVDFTDIGGEVVAGCAPSDPATGREALEAAGFSPTNSPSGFICAIDAAPDPCPESFEGSFWAYWHSTADGAWTSYTVGADSSDPVPGQLEGWRYNDGTVPPGIAPADAANALPATTATGSTATDAAEADSEPALAPSDGTVLVIVLGLAAVVIVIIVVLLVIRSRRGAAGSR